MGAFLHSANYVHRAKTADLDSNLVFSGKYGLF